MRSASLEDMTDDQISMVTGIFYEPFVGFEPTANHPGQVNTLNIGHHGHRIMHGRLVGIGTCGNADGSQKIKVRKIPCHGKDKIVGYGFNAIGR